MLTSEADGSPPINPACVTATGGAGGRSGIVPRLARTPMHVMGRSKNMHHHPLGPPCSQSWPLSQLSARPRNSKCPSIFLTLLIRIGTFCISATIFLKINSRICGVLNYMMLLQIYITFSKKILTWISCDTPPLPGRLY